MASRASITAYSAKPPRAASHQAVAGRHTGDAITTLTTSPAHSAAARLWRAALAAQQLAAIQRGGTHADDDLAGLGLRRGRLAQLDRRSLAPAAISTLSSPIPPLGLLA